MLMVRRGRPKWRMTERREQVLRELKDCAAKGKRVTTTELAERCGLHSYRDARRIIADLVLMGMLGQ